MEYTTERKRVTDALRESEEQFESLFNHAPLGVYLVDNDLVIRKVNPVALPVFGDIPGGPVGRDFDDVIHILWDKEYADEVVRVFKQTLETGESCVMPERAEHRGDRDAVEYYEWRVDRIPLSGGQYGVVCYFRDISAQVQARQEIEKAGELARANKSRQAFILKLSDALRPLGDPMEVQTAALRVLGEHLAVNRAFFNEIDEEQDAYVIHRTYANGVAPLTGHFRLSDIRWTAELAGSGQTVVFDDASADPRLSEAERASYLAMEVTAGVGVPLIKDGRWIAGLGVHHATPRHWTPEDIDLIRETAERTWAAVERAQAEGTLRENERRLRTLFDSIDEGFMEVEVVMSADGRVLDWRYLTLNAAFQRLTGLPDIRGKLVSEFMPDLEPEWAERFAHVVNTGEAIRFEQPTQELGRWFEVYFVRVGDTGSRRVAAVYNDVTERKRAELALRESEERQAFLLKLSDALRAESSAEAIANRALRILFEHMRLDRCYIAVYRLAEDIGEFPHQVHDDGLPPLPAQARLSDFPKGLQVVSDRTLVIEDVVKMEGLSDSERASFASLGVGALINATLRKGENIPLWALCAVSTGPRVWTQGEVSLVEEVAERTWAAVERARAEASARDSETRMRSLFGASPAPFLVLQADAPRFTITEVNDAYLAATMRTREDLVGRGVFEAFPDNPEDETIEGVSTLRASLERVLSSRAADAMPALQYDIARPDGTFEVRWWCPINSPVLDDTGQVGSIIHNANDVTEKYRADAALRDSEAQVADVLEGMSEGFVLLDRDFRIARINSEGLRIDGRPASELLGKTHWEVWPGSEEAPQGVLYKRLMRERASGALEIEYDWPERRAWFETRIDPVRDGLAVFFRDVSERKAAESVVREVEDRLRLATDNAEIGFWDVDLVADVLIWPPRTKAMFGISPDAPVSMDDFYAGLHPEDREATAAAYAAAADPDRRALYDVEYRTIGKNDGVVRWVAAKGRGVFDAAGRCLRVVGTAIDVTARKVTETALRKSDNDLRESGERVRLLEELALGPVEIHRE